MSLLNKSTLTSRDSVTNTTEPVRSSRPVTHKWLGSLSATQLVLLVSCYFFFVLNIALIAKLAGIIGKLDDVKLGFVISLPLFFIAALNIIFNIFTLFRIEKWVLIPLVAISSLLSYAMYNYGIIVDQDMLANVIETNPGEAKSYFNANMIIWFFVMGAVPAYFIMKVNVKRSSAVRDVGHKLIAITLSLLVIGAIAGLYYKDYASVGRNNAYLKKMIIPTDFLYSSFRFTQSNLLTPPKFQILGEDAVVKIDASAHKKQVMVLLLGETARAANFQYAGYERDTNAFTQPLDVTYFEQMSSCGTATAVSVPCMFSRMTRQEFSKSAARNEDNLLDVVQRAGIKTVWLENDGGCKGVCSRVETIEFDPKSDHPACDGDYCKDQILLDGLDAQLANLTESHNLIVLHMVGSHGPTYYRRYPAEFAHFQPVCQRSDIQNCDASQLVNTYDNTLYYTDYIISQVIGKLNQREDLDAGVVYISDHGESLGELGFYLHGVPYLLAPKEQTQVPMLTWFSDSFIAKKKLDKHCLAEKAKYEEFSHDNLFDSLLGLLDVSTHIYQPQLDVFNSCRQGPANYSRRVATK